MTNMHRAIPEEKLTEAYRLLLEMRDNCVKHADDQYDDPKREAKREALNIALTAMGRSFPPRWISVEERLPERGTWVLCCGAKGGLFLSDWLIPHNINTNDNTVYCSVPNARSGRYAKYWMPLPEPPKEE